MLASASEVSEQVVILAAGGFEGVGEGGEAGGVEGAFGELALLICLAGQFEHRGREQASVEGGQRAERVPEGAPEQPAQRPSRLLGAFLAPV